MKVSFANGSLCIWLTKAVDALRNRNKVQITHAAPSMHSAPQVGSGWDYCPRDVVRRDRALDYEAARGSGVGEPSTPNQDDDVWLDFTNPEPKTESAPTGALPPGDGCKLSTYDQSPIDNNGVGAE